MLIGTDAEAFVRSKSTGEYLAACGKLGGKKGSPVDIGNGFAVQEDNVTVEFNIPPCISPSQFVDCLATAKKEVAAYVQTKFNEPVELVYTDAANFSDSQLAHRLAREFGCTPELDAYATGGRFPSPEIGNSTFRFAGFHLHFGFLPDSFNVPGFVAATMLEALMSPAGSHGLLDGAAGATALRHQFYGKPGAYRDTVYPGGYVGIEYRRMGSLALRHLSTVRDLLTQVWTPFETLCRDRKAAAEFYRGLDLAAMNSRLYSESNYNLIEETKKKFGGR